MVVIIVIEQQQMDCCCPGDREPQYGVYVNNLQSVRVPAQKSKFSFRTTAAGSSHSRLSHSSLSEDHQQELDEELHRLEQEYERLKEEEAEIEYFERNRVHQLEEEVAFYQRQIKERSRDIEELNNLFRLRLQERQQSQMMPQPRFYSQPQPQPAQIVHFPQANFKNGNDDTSISSIPPNS